LLCIYLALSFALYISAKQFILQNIKALLKSFASVIIFSLICYLYRENFMTNTLKYVSYSENASMFRQIVFQWCE